MATDDLFLSKGKPLLMRRSVVAPDWNEEKVLTSDIWMYVDLWLRRNAGKTEAVFYWDQAREFYRASLNLPVTASPLTLYYCFLNATKALLSAKKIRFEDRHGLTGSSEAGKASIAKERVTLKGAGVLPSLIAYYGDAMTNDTYSLKDMLYNLAFVHRAYCLSYEEKYLFFSLDNCRYVRATDSTESWVTANLEDHFDDLRILATLTPGFEKDAGFADELVVRKKKRFRWKNGAAQQDNNLKRLTSYHGRLRRDITYIAGVGRWYLKRRLATATIIDRHAPTLIFASMHRLSELSRYDPLRLSKLLESQRNWLLAEFIKTAPIQFLDEIACELTGQEIFVPGIHSGSLLSVTS
ncbi:YaaC family protein [Rhizobium sp. 768_B6_N1_8]|uniref:YaaC family protein n=1 Tax=unclassified Rhizobium TaxID=2613769 RepID=UPI003F254646